VTQPRTSLNQGGEEVFQMLWDCRFCGTTKLLGLDHRHCPNCGAQQDPKWRYFPSDTDMKFVTDTDYTYAGVDVVCPFCSTPNSANAKFCKQCGADIVNGKPAELITQQSTGMEGTSGVREDLALKEFNARTAPPAAKFKFPPVLLGVLAVAAVIIIGLIVLSRSTYGATIQVTNLTWERNIFTETYTAAPGSGWRDSVPIDAYSVSCSPRQREYTDSESYQCGFEVSDRGDGSGARRPKMCQRNVTRYETDSFCSYAINRWIPGQTYSQSGGPTDPLAWPLYTPRGSGISIGATRESRREQDLRVLFDGTGDKAGSDFTYEVEDESSWMTFKVGQAYSVDINRLEQVQWNTLKTLAQ